MATDSRSEQLAAGNWVEYVKPLGLYQQRRYRGIVEKVSRTGKVTILLSTPIPKPPPVLLQKRVVVPASDRGLLRLLFPMTEVANVGA